MRVFGLLAAFSFSSVVLADFADADAAGLPGWFGWGSGSSSDSTPNVSTGEANSKAKETLASNALDKTSNKLGNQATDKSKATLDKPDKTSLSTVVVEMPDGTTKTTTGHVVVTETVVASYTVSASGPTILNENGKQYLVTTPTVLTITDCPCTRTLTFMTSTVTKCVCTTESLALPVLSQNDMPVVDASVKLGLGSLVVTLVAAIIVMFL